MLAILNIARLGGDIFFINIYRASAGQCGGRNKLGCCKISSSFLEKEPRCLL